jgi:DNA polymerase III gamma/tau subunit
MLFVGPAGCGKTTLAYIIANHLGVYGTTYLKEYNSAAFRGIDTVRDIQEETRTATLGNRTRVYMFEEAHMWTKDAKEGLLKALEHQPKGCWFIVTTSDPQKLYSGLKDSTALKRRFTEFTVSAVTDTELSGLLTKTMRKVRKRVPQEIITQIVRDSLGSPGMALNILDKVIDLDPADMATEARRWAEKEVKVINLCQAIMKIRKKQIKPKEVYAILEQLEDEDAESSRRQILEYLRKVMKSGDRWVRIIGIHFEAPYYDTGKWGLWGSVYDALEAVGLEKSNG